MHIDEYAEKGDPTKVGNSNEGRTYVWSLDESL